MVIFGVLWGGGKTQREQPTLIPNYSPLRPFPKRELEEGGGKR